MANPEFTTEELANEEWRDIPSYEGYYQASNLGRIKRIKPGTNAKVGKIKPVQLDRYGYPKLLLSKEGIKKTPTVHRLVAAAFLGIMPQGMTVNHKDGNKTNNKITNLEYLTNRDNLRHAALNGLMARGERNRHAKLTKEQVLEIRASSDRPSVLARRYGITQASIHSIIKRRNWPHV